MLVGIGALAALATIFLLVVQLGNIGGDQVPINPGGTSFVMGDASDLAVSVAESGPLLLPDASGGERDIWLQHLGPGPTDGWLAFAVRPLEAPRDCFADWDAAQSEFVDTCNGTTYPENGEGLKQYPVTITDDSKVQLNLGIG